MSMASRAKDWANEWANERGDVSKSQIYSKRCFQECWASHMDSQWAKNETKKGTKFIWGLTKSLEIWMMSRVEAAAKRLQTKSNYQNDGQAWWNISCPRLEKWRQSNFWAASRSVWSSLLLERARAGPIKWYKLERQRPFYNLVAWKIEKSSR